MLKKLRELITFYLAYKDISLRYFCIACGIHTQTLWRFMKTKNVALNVTTYEKIISFLKSNSAGIEYPEELKELIA